MDFRLYIPLLAVGILPNLAFANSNDATVALNNNKPDVSVIKRMASGSSCAKKSWRNNRGVAPTPYIEGVALVFARSVCQPDRADVRIVSAPAEPTHLVADALAVYDDKFKQLGMQNNKAGADTLRHSYLLLIGLGMMESSGKYCEGRDVSQCFTTAESAESGLFQTSYGASKFSAALPEMTKQYNQGVRGCMLEDFQGDFSCKIRKSHNSKCPDVTSDVAGTGPGADWQKLTKTCPAFATEYAAVVLRTHGGTKGEFNPIRKQQAELAIECDNMLKAVQDYVEKNPDACNVLSTY